MAVAEDLKRDWMRRIHSWVAYVSNFFIFLTLRLALVECSFGEVQRGGYDPLGTAWPNLVVPKALDFENVDIVEKYALSVEAEVKTRHDRVDGKLRAILGMNALAFGLSNGLALALNVYFCVVAIPIVLSSVIGLRATGVHTFQVATLSSEDLLRPKNELLLLLANDRLRAANANSRVVDFMADCLRAAHRIFLVGILIALPLAYFLKSKS